MLACPGVEGGQVVAGHFRKAQDAADDVVEVVGDAGGQGAEGFELAGLFAPEQLFDAAGDLFPEDHAMGHRQLHQGLVEARGDGVEGQLGVPFGDVGDRLLMERDDVVRRGLVADQGAPQLEGFDQLELGLRRAGGEQEALEDVCVARPGGGRGVGHGQNSSILGGAPAAAVSNSSKAA